MTFRTSLRRFGMAAVLGGAVAGCDTADTTAEPAGSGTDAAAGPEEVAPVLIPAGTVETSDGRDPAATPEQPNPPVVTEDETRTGAGVKTDGPAAPAAENSGDPLP